MNKPDKSGAQRRYNEGHFAGQIWLAARDTIAREETADILSLSSCNPGETQPKNRSSILLLFTTLGAWLAADTCFLSLVAASSQSPLKDSKPPYAGQSGEMTIEFLLDLAESYNERHYKGDPLER
jgi:hypothetical protein